MQLAETKEILRYHVFDDAGDAGGCLESDLAVQGIGLILKSDVCSPVEQDLEITFITVN